MQVMISHEVENFSVWKKSFDSDLKNRMTHGATGRQKIFRDINNQNNVHISMEWNRKENFERYNNSEVTHKAVQEAKVIGDPAVIFFDESKEMRACTCSVMQ